LARTRVDYPLVDRAFYGLGYSHGQAMDHQLPDSSWTDFEKFSFLWGYEFAFGAAVHELEEAREAEMNRLANLITAERGLRPGEFWSGPDDCEEFGDDEDEVDDDPDVWTDSYGD
jgi:hypothetical protein